MSAAQGSGLTKTCWKSDPSGRYHCTLPAGHKGDHKHAYSGPSVNGVRQGTTWAR